MKISVFLLILTLGWLESYGQVEPIFPYNHPPKATLFTFATSGTTKGNAWAEYLISKVNNGLRDTSYRVSSVDEIFPNLFLEDVSLHPGTYINSGYDLSHKNMKESVGNKWDGFAWVYRIGTFAITVIKGDCGNILTVEVVRTLSRKPFSEPKLPEEPEWRPRPLPRIVEKEIPVSTPKKEEVKNFPWGWVAAGVAGGVLAYELLKKKPVVAGGPGGAPSTTGGDTGGPGGAPSTTSLSTMNLFVLNRTMTVPKSVVFVPVRANTAIGFGLSKHGASASFTFNF